MPRLLRERVGVAVTHSGFFFGRFVKVCSSPMEPIDKDADSYTFNGEKCDSTASAGLTMTMWGTGGGSQNTHAGTYRQAPKGAILQ
jgi:hypothetical protein